MVKKVNTQMLVMEKQENLMIEVEQQENGSVSVCESDERVSEKLAVVEYHLFFPQFSIHIHYLSILYKGRGSSFQWLCQGKYPV